MPRLKKNGKRVLAAFSTRLSEGWYCGEMKSLQKIISDPQDVIPMIPCRPVQTAKGNSTFVLKTACLLQSITKQIMIKPTRVIHPYSMNIKRKGRKLLLQKRYNSVATNAELPKNH